MRLTEEAATQLGAGVLLLICVIVGSDEPSSHFSQMKKLEFPNAGLTCRELSDVVNDRTEVPTSAFRTRPRTLSQVNHFPNSSTLSNLNVSRDQASDKRLYLLAACYACPKPCTCIISLQSQPPQCGSYDYPQFTDGN